MNTTSSKQFHVPSPSSRNKEAMRLSGSAHVPSILHRGRPELQGLGTRTAYSRKEQSNLERIDRAMGSMETWYWYGTLTCEQGWITSRLG